MELVLHIKVLLVNADPHGDLTTALGWTNAEVHWKYNAENQKENPEIAFDKERDKMIVVFDGDIFEKKVLDYDELVAEGEIFCNCWRTGEEYRDCY